MVGAVGGVPVDTIAGVAGEAPVAAPAGAATAVATLEAVDGVNLLVAAVVHVVDVHVDVLGSVRITRHCLGNADAEGVERRAAGTRAAAEIDARSSDRTSRHRCRCAP